MSGSCYFRRALFPSASALRAQTLSGGRAVFFPLLLFFTTDPLTTSVPRNQTTNVSKLHKIRRSGTITVEGQVGFYRSHAESRSFLMELVFFFRTERERKPGDHYFPYYYGWLVFYDAFCKMILSTSAFWPLLKKGHYPLDKRKREEEPN